MANGNYCHLGKWDKGKEGYAEGEIGPLKENFIWKQKIYSSLSVQANPIQTTRKNPLTPKRV